ncbi:MAG TPA: DUF3150 domain-containing protein [Ktedonobacteraceae bacterium]
MQQIVTTQSTQVSQETPHQQTVARLLGAQSFAAIHWQLLMQDGALVELHIGRCRFSARLVPEDVGIHIDDEGVREKLARWTTLGEKRLFPESSLQRVSRVESRARAALKEHAFRTELGYFVPMTAYESWRAQTETLRDEYMALRDDLISNHADLVREVLAEYEVIATDTYHRLRRAHPELVQEDQQHFVALYVNRIANLIPSVEKIRDSFSFRFFRVSAPQLLGAPTEAGETSSEEAQASAAGSPAHARTEQQRQRTVVAHDVHSDAQRRVNAMLDEWLTTIVAHLRALVYDASMDVLATLQRRGGERFSPRSVVQLKNLLTQIRSLNFFGDAEIDTMMARIEQIVSLSPATRQHSLSEIQQTLRAIATTTRATLLELGTDTRAPRSDLGIAALSSAQMVHAARAELHLPPLDPARMAALQPATRSARAELAVPGAGSLWQFAEQQPARGARTL